MSRFEAQKKKSRTITCTHAAQKINTTLSERPKALLTVQDGFTIKISSQERCTHTNAGNVRNFILATRTEEKMNNKLIVSHEIDLSDLGQVMTLILINVICYFIGYIVGKWRG